jgi:hypothetical protein
VSLRKGGEDGRGHCGGGGHDEKSVRYAGVVVRLVRGARLGRARRGAQGCPAHDALSVR